jgi:hypothetical protein
VLGNRDSRSFKTKLIWFTRDTIEVWLEHVGLEAASHNYVSAASSVLAMWLNSGSVQSGSDFASDCIRCRFGAGIAGQTKVCHGFLD